MSYFKYLTIYVKFLSIIEIILLFCGINIVGISFDNFGYNKLINFYCYLSLIICTLQAGMVVLL